jgi:hypothetical protein
MKGLDDMALWLLSDLYGPTCFGVHRRTYSHACKAGRLEFPNRSFRLREIRVIHQNALGVVKRGLRELGMIPVRQMRTVRESRRRLRSAGAGHHYHGGQAANRG